MLIFRESPLAFLAAMTDGVLAVAILAAASLAGLWIVWATSNGNLPVRWQIGLGAGFGIGTLSLGMLVAGLYGCMGRTTWWIVLGVQAAAGLLALQRLSDKTNQPSLPAAPGEHSATAGNWRWMWLLIIPAVVLGVLAATVPPGLLWHEEGNGFDVLEYHLGVPKEHFVNGRITYLDHNMYSNFPMNAEMLYLLSMILFGSPFKAAIAAQVIHLGLGALAAYAAWLIGRDYSPKAGIVAGIAGAAFPWSIYLGAMAYVENGMLFYGLLAAGLCNRAIREPNERNGSRALAVGAMVGLACGYKYTAVPMIAIPLLVLWFLVNLTSRPAKIMTALIPLLVAAAFFGPWMGKNLRMTGDPFFPLGYRVFGSHVWTDADYARFVQGHSPLPEERPVPIRLKILWQRVIADPRFGWVPWVAAGLAGWLAVTRRLPHRGQALIWLTILALQILLWLFTTHLFARFASVLWIPLVFLISAVAAQLTAPATPADGFAVPGNPVARTGPRAAGPRPSFASGTLCVAGLLVYLVISQGWLFREYRGRLYVQGRQLPVHGNTDIFLSGKVSNLDHLEFINGDGPEHVGLPPDARLLMVNDVCAYYVNRPCDYSVVFSHDRFARAVEETDGSANGVLSWLRQQGYTHVWANFAGMGQLGDPHLQTSRQVTPNLFARLEKAGLKRLQEVRLGGDGVVYGVLYTVPGA